MEKGYMVHTRHYDVLSLTSICLYTISLALGLDLAKPVSRALTLVCREEVGGDRAWGQLACDSFSAKRKMKMGLMSQ